MYVGPRPVCETLGQVLGSDRNPSDVCAAISPLLKGGLDDALKTASPPQDIVNAMLAFAPFADSVFKVRDMVETIGNLRMINRPPVAERVPFAETGLMNHTHQANPATLTHDLSIFVRAAADGSLYPAIQEAMPGHFDHGGRSDADEDAIKLTIRHKAPEEYSAILRAPFISPDPVIFQPYRRPPVADSVRSRQRGGEVRTPRARAEIGKRNDGRAVTSWTITELAFLCGGQLLRDGFERHRNPNSSALFAGRKIVEAEQNFGGNDAA